MTYLYLCAACERGDHPNCEKGHPAPPGVFGGSKCKCFDASHNKNMQEIKNSMAEVAILEIQKTLNIIGDVYSSTNQVVTMLNKIKSFNNLDDKQATNALKGIIQRLKSPVIQKQIKKANAYIGNSNNAIGMIERCRKVWADLSKDDQNLIVALMGGLYHNNSVRAIIT